MPRFIFVPWKLLSKFKLLVNLKKWRRIIYSFLLIFERMIRKISLFILFSKKMRNCSKPCFQKLKRRNPKKKKKQKELEKDSGNAPLPSTNFLSYRFPSIPEEEKWGDVWQLYSRLIATEHRASVVHKFSYFSDERVPPKVVDKRSAREEEGRGRDMIYRALISGTVVLGDTRLISKWVGRR